MTFNSFTFAIFLPIVFAFYWLFNRHLKLQNLFIIVASYVFYGWWDWRFLILIFITSFCSWGSGLLIDQYQKLGRLKIAQRLLISNIVLNLLILGFFKYYNFFVESFFKILPFSRESLPFSTLYIILPVGISFYTFQALSYSIDVYRKNIKATKELLPFLAYVSFFPQLVAGPIERATNLLPQFLQNRTFSYPLASEGMRQILWGLFKKIVVADTCATVVNSIFSNAESYNGTALFLGAILFSFQIYGDFSGYSDIAIGLAKLFGIKLMRNFHCPHFSRDIAEFWRRWHISLNTWFRDYLYIPLGGSHGSKFMIIRNTLITFVVSGLWHGANWTYVVWGAFHAILFLPLILIHSNRKYLDVVAQNSVLPSIKELWQMIFTFLLVTIGLVIFRSDNIENAFFFLTKMFTNISSAPNIRGLEMLAVMESAVAISFLLIIEWINRRESFSFYLMPKSKFLRWSGYCLLALACFICMKTDQTFIYFQF